MCIAVYNPADEQAIDYRTFKRMRDRNPDGLGMTWAEDGEVKVFKTLDRMDLMFDLYLELHESEIDTVLHFRAATKGDVCLDNCHPFFVNEDMTMVHNGTVSIPQLPDGKCDTIEFRDRILRILPDDWIENPDFRDMVNSYSGWSRFVFVRSNGEIHIINEDEGYWEDGSWFSNRGYKKYKSKTRNTGRGWYSYHDDDENNPNDRSRYRHLPAYDEDENEDEDVETETIEVEGEEEDIKLPVKAGKEDSYLYEEIDEEYYTGFLIGRGEGKPVGALCENCIDSEAIGNENVMSIDEYYYLATEDYVAQYCDNCFETLYPETMLRNFEKIEREA